MAHVPVQPQPGTVPREVTKAWGCGCPGAPRLLLAGVVGQALVSRCCSDNPMGILCCSQHSSKQPEHKLTDRIIIALTEVILYFRLEILITGFINLQYRVKYVQNFHVCI